MCELRAEKSIRRWLVRTANPPLDACFWKLGGLLIGPQVGWQKKAKNFNSRFVNALPRKVDSGRSEIGNLQLTKLAQHVT